MNQKKPLCLECQFLVWQGFLGHCVNILMDDSLLDEATELEIKLISAWTLRNRNSWVPSLSFLS